MHLIKRPIQNIKNIDLDLIAWVSFWITCLLLVTIPIQAISDIDNIFSLLFSFDFIEKVEIKQNRSLLIMSTYEVWKIEKLNELYTFINIFKVVFWIVTLGFIGRLLFKHPKK